MSERNRWLAAIVGGLVAIALIVGVATTLQRGQDEEPPATPGHWPAKERVAFINSCVDKCRAAPGVTPERYPICDRACKCAADEGEKIMAVDEMVAVYRNGTADHNEKIKQITQAGIACAK